MHMYCTGSGSPTIVLDAGLGDDAVIWSAVQPALANTTRVCAYDRAGFGRSQAGPAPRDADHIAAELHGLLRQARIDLPIVLMGHSIAGIYMRAYAAHYPEDLAGMVFVAGSTPMQQENPAIKAMIGKSPPPWVIALVGNAAFSIGIPRLDGMRSNIPLASMHGPRDCRRRITARFMSILRSTNFAIWNDPASKRCIRAPTAHCQFSFFRMILTSL